MSRLALAYAPARARDPWLALLALDARLGGILRSAREPMLAQLKLAWWRDRLSDAPEQWPKGEPMLALLAPWAERARDLVSLVDGWEGLLGEPPLTQAALDGFAAGRVAGIRALAGVIGAPSVADAGAREWALCELALHRLDPSERAAARDLAGNGAGGRVSRALRPLAVLAGLNRRALRRDANDAIDGPGAVLAAIRLGILGL